MLEEGVILRSESQVLKPRVESSDCNVCSVIIVLADDSQQLKRWDIIPYYALKTGVTDLQ